MLRRIKVVPRATDFKGFFRTLRRNSKVVPAAIDFTIFFALLLPLEAVNLAARQSSPAAGVAISAVGDYHDISSSVT